MNSKILSFLAVTVLLSACGGGGSDAVEASSKDIKGNWQSKCAAVDILGNSNNTEMAISSSELVKTVSEFDTSDCFGTPEFVEISKYNLKNTGSSSNGFCEFTYVDTVLTSVSINGVLLSPEEAAAYTDEFGQTNYDIACKVDDQLYFGLEDEEFNTGSAEARPVEMNTQADVVFTPAFATEVEGDWVQACRYYEDFGQAKMFWLSISTTQRTLLHHTYLTTTDCSGEPDHVEEIEADLRIAGTVSIPASVYTPSCIADKIDTKIRKIKVNGVVLSDELSADYSRYFGATDHDIVCNVDGELYHGLRGNRDGTGNNLDRRIEAERPTELNTLPFADYRE